MEGLIKFILVIISCVWSLTLAENNGFGISEAEDSLQDLNDLRSLRTKLISTKNCCVRETKDKFIGTDAVTGEEINLDIGRCRKRCNGEKPLKKKAFQKLIQENPNVDPRELFIRHNIRNTRRKHACPKGQSCTESRSRIETLATVEEGEVVVNILEECSCQLNPRICRRQPKITKFYEGTPLETSVDTGKCSGHCHGESKCKAIASKTVSIQGPNGAECISTISECSCASSCFRFSHYEHHFHFINGTATEKIMDIGRCVGSCEESVTSKCVLRKKTDEDCLMSLTPEKLECQPTEVINTSLTNENGSSKNISTIVQCSCY